MSSILLSFFFALALIVVVQSFQKLGVQNVSPAGRGHRTVLAMGGNKATFGIFSPAVYAAKYILGEAKLNKVKSILH
jgi:hypothetical protein